MDNFFSLDACSRPMCSIHTPCFDNLLTIIKQEHTHLSHPHLEFTNIQIKSQEVEVFQCSDSCIFKSFNVCQKIMSSAVKESFSSAADIWECERLARQNNCSDGRKRLSSVLLQVFVEMSLSEIWSIIDSVQNYTYDKMMSRKIDVERFVWYVSNIR